MAWKPRMRFYPAVVSGNVMEANLEFDGAEDYLTLANQATLEIGTRDFAVEIGFNPDSTAANPTVEKPLVAKAPGFLDNSEKGFMVNWLPSTDSLVVHFNDGNATKLTKTYTGAVTDNTWQYFRLEFDRDGYVYVYKNGVLYDQTFSISGRQNALDGTDAWSIGCDNAGTSTRLFDGWIDLVAFDMGQGVTGSAVSNGAEWNLERYWQWYYLFNPTNRFGFVLHFLSQNFTSAGFSKYGEPKTYTWTHQGATPDFDGISRDYDFEFDALPESLERSWAETDTPLRALDGTLRNYAGARKQRVYMVLRTTSIKQVTAIQAAYAMTWPIWIAWKDNYPFNHYYFTIPPMAVELARDSALNRVWEVEMEIEEV